MMKDAKKCMRLPVCEASKTPTRCLLSIYHLMLGTTGYEQQKV